MNFPNDFNPEQIAQYEEIFASGGGERLLTAWEDSYAWTANGGHPTKALDIRALREALNSGKLDFVCACLRVLPDRFFDVKRPLRVRDNEALLSVLYSRMYALAAQPERLAGYHDVAELLVRRGWDPLYGRQDEPSRRGMHPMLQQIAGITGSAPLLRRILPHVGGHDAVRRYSDSFCNGFLETTLLHRAVESRDGEMVRFFVSEVGVDPNSVDAKGRTALMPYLSLLSGGESSKVARTEEVVRELVALGLDLERRDSGGDTALFHAVGGDHVAAVRFLIELGANPNARDREGRTALEMAEHEGVGAEAVRYLRSLELGNALREAMPDEEASPNPNRSSGGLTL